MRDVELWQDEQEKKKYYPDIRSYQRPKRAFSSEGGSRRKLQMCDCQPELRFAL